MEEILTYSKLKIKLSERNIKNWPVLTNMDSVSSKLTANCNTSSRTLARKAILTKVAPPIQNQIAVNPSTMSVLVIAIPSCHVGPAN